VWTAVDWLVPEEAESVAATDAGTAGGTVVVVGATDAGTAGGSVVVVVGGSVVVVVVPPPFRPGSARI